MENTAIVVFLLLGMAFIGLLSKKYRFPLPIALVLCGVAISVIPGLPVVTLNPDVVFIIFLPPLLYAAAWFTSWHDFKANLRPISLAAIGLVVATTVIVAMAAHWLIPGLSWPVAFLVGAIVSPPDAVAATSITRGLGLNPRIITILEGESLVNDASGLVAYKYALIAITAGSFHLWEASLNFLIVACAGIAIGLAVGYLMYIVHKKFVCDAAIEVTFTFITPFVSYLLAEHFHFSGVLAVVTTGLYLTFRASEMFTNESRIMAYSAWEVVIFILNGLVFILIGLQLRGVMQGIRDYSAAELALYGGVISLVVIIIRFIWVVPSAYIPRLISKRIRDTEPLDPRNLVIFGWAGMRGVVSMAAALAIPLVLPDGTAFPHRNLVIFLSFCVILTTLLLLGTTLPWIIRVMKMQPHSLALEEYEIRTKVVTHTIGHIEENFSLIQDELLHNIKSKYEVKYNRLQRTELPSNYFGQGKTLAGNIFDEFTQLQIDLISEERKQLELMHRTGEASEEIIRKIERELDLEETRLQMEKYQG